MRKLSGISCKGWGVLWSVMALPILVFASATARAEDDSVCARVKIEIKQELSLERQAFDANMRIINGLATMSLDPGQTPNARSSPAAPPPCRAR